MHKVYSVQLVDDKLQHKKCSDLNVPHNVHKDVKMQH